MSFLFYTIFCIIPQRQLAKLIKSQPFEKKTANQDEICRPKQVD